MYLDDFFTRDGIKYVNKLSQESATVNMYYRFWLDNLFERVMRLFVWENTYDTETHTGVKPKEIEARLHLSGFTAITKLQNELTSMFASFYGVTKYQDEFTNVNVRCPIYSGSRIINKDVVIIDNTSLRNATYALVHHYALLLAHNESTFVRALINVRDAGGVPIVSTEKQKQSYMQYAGKLYNGQFTAVSDPAFLGVQFGGTDKHTNQNILDIYTIREKLLKSFYSDIGVRSAFEKRSNAVQAEVEADTSMLLLNLSDMLECRKKGAEAVNNIFGTKWSVHIAEEIDYGAENERIQFNSNDTLHVDNGQNNIDVIDESGEK